MAGEGTWPFRKPPVPAPGIAQELMGRPSSMNMLRIRRSLRILRLCAAGFDHGNVLQTRLAGDIELGLWHAQKDDHLVARSHRRGVVVLWSRTSSR